MNGTGWSRHALVVALVAVSAGCGRESDIERRTYGLLSSEEILSFDVPSGWSLTAGTGSSTPVRTQGVAAYQLDNPANHTVLSSGPLSSSAAALGGLAEAGSQIALDVMLPAKTRAPANAGSLQIFASCPSLGVQDAYLGKIPFAGQRPGIFTTVKLEIPAAVRAALGAGSYTDLTLKLALHVPGNPRLGVTYLFDNLRVRSPSTPPAGAGQSADLVAQLSYAPPSSSPAVANFPVGVVQVPQSFHVRLGGAGTGSVLLELGFGGTPRVSCTYGADSGGTSYSLSSCTGDAQAGDLLGADFARLTILGGDAAAGPTKIRAQLAINPVGDTAGGGIIPPLPTFWGGTAADASAIVTAYFNAVNATPATEEMWITAPVPEIARRFGDGTPHDNLTGPPPPNDPPFDEEGHLNDGGDWDAYYRLHGNLAADNTANRNKAHFEATLAANAVLWGRHVSVASVNTTVDTDNGEVDKDGFRTPSASGSLHMYLFGTEVPGGGSASPSTGFNYDLSTTATYDLPPISIWIFSIEMGVNAKVKLAAAGSLSFGGFNLGINPEVEIGAHIFGGVDVVVASGGVDVTVNLLKLRTPMLAQAYWVVSTDPAICNGSLTFLLDGKAEVSSLGGQVDLKAKFGICPFCRHETWTLFKWDPLLSTTHELFHSTTTNQIFPLPSALCQVDLVATISEPADGAGVMASIPIMLRGSVTRPATAGTTTQYIDCAHWTWSSSDPADVGFGTGDCSPLVTFASSGPRTVTLTATDPYGETGTATIDLTVTAAPSALTAYIDLPAADTSTAAYDPVALHGGAINGTAPYSYSWSVTSSAGISSLGTGQSASLTFPDPMVVDTFVVQLTVTDSVGATSTATRIIDKNVIP